MYLRTRPLSAAASTHSTLYIFAFGAGIAIWLVSLLVPTPARFVLWAIALVMEFCTPIVGARQADRPPAHPGHFQERFALFAIIVLGESFVKTLTEIAETGVSFHTQVFGALTFLISVALWWTYFDDIAASTIAPRVGRIDNPGVVRVLWVYAHLLLAMGLTAFGVASKKIVGLEDFAGSLRSSYLWLITGSIATVLAAVAVVDAVTVSSHFAVRTRMQLVLRLGAAALVLATADGSTKRRRSHRWE